MVDTKEIIRILGFIQEYFDNHADEQEPDCRKELFRDWSEITLDAIILLKAKEQEPVEPTRKNGAYFCGNPYCRKIIAQMVPCGASTHRVKYCSECGMAVKWE